MTDIFIVITQDRHADVEAAPFADEAAAFAHAESQVEGTHDQDRELNDAMRRDGWLWYCGYGTEGDCVRVVRRELR
jgi:hypothetical protein